MYYRSISSSCCARMSAKIIIPTHLLKLIKIHLMKTSSFGKMIVEHSFGNTINKFSYFPTLIFFQIYKTTQYYKYLHCTSDMNSKLQ